MHQITVLLIEAHPAVRLALVERLAADPCLSVVAQAATPATPHGDNTRRPDVILYAVTGRDNLDPTALDALQNAYAPPPALIILTSFANDIAHGAAFRPGPRRYLLKDINSADLINIIRSTAVADPSTSNPKPANPC